MACIASFMARIQPKILHDLDKCVFLVVTKFGSDTTSHFSAVTDLKYAILQGKNKDPVTIFTSMRHLRHCPDV